MKNKLQLLIVIRRRRLSLTGKVEEVAGKFSRCDMALIYLLELK
jgi:hypothetical protein